MGCDIHMMLRWKDWRDEHQFVEAPPRLGDRNYRFFAFLAGVRDNYQIDPILDPRGLPEWPEISGDTLQLSGGGEKWLGDHSHSWLSLDEIAGAELPVAHCSGVISAQEYWRWDKVSEPDNYCGGIWGKDIKVGKIGEDDCTHYMVHWSMEDCGILEKWLMLRYWVMSYASWRDENPIVVFGFDS